MNRFWWLVAAFVLGYLVCATSFIECLFIDEEDCLIAPVVSIVFPGINWEFFIQHRGFWFLFFFFLLLAVIAYFERRRR